MTKHLKTAAYFEGRAKRARHKDDRVRFLAVVQRYRAKALEVRGLATKAVQPNAAPNKRNPALQSDARGKAQQRSTEVRKRPTRQA
jgi:hypothetical protein